jgi:hypothetical protein
MAGKYENPEMISNLFNLKQQEYLTLSAKDYSEKKLAEKEAEIENRMMAAQAPKSNTLLYVILGVVAVGLITFAVLKKKKIL